MKSFATRARIEIKDRMRYSPLVRFAGSGARLLSDRFKPAPDADGAIRAVERLCGAARWAAEGPLLRHIESRIDHRLAGVNLASVDWTKYVPAAKDRRISKAAIIKPRVGPDEPGVLFVSFEDQWARLMHGVDLQDFSQRYTLVVAPTWCPPHSLVNVAFPALYPTPFFTTISNLKDLQFFPRLSPKYLPVPLFASSWVNPAFYNPLPRDRRDIDIVMVANFGTYKRHHALFAALRDMPRETRVLLIGQPQDGRNADVLKREAALYGVEDRITLRSSVTNEFLAESLCRAKISLILSRREGSCVAVAESMFADTPVGLLHDAEVGSKAFINEQTGRLLDERTLAGDLSGFIAASNSYAPRRWADENISCHKSTNTLNDHLREHALKSGRPWTRDIAPFYWRPDPQVIGQESMDWIAGETAAIREQFGLEMGPSTPKSAASQPDRNPSSLKVQGSPDSPPMIA